MNESNTIRNHSNQSPSCYVGAEMMRTMIRQKRSFMNATKLVHRSKMPDENECIKNQTMQYSSTALVLSRGGGKNAGCTTISRTELCLLVVEDLIS
jgi:hypothetical protein